MKSLIEFPSKKEYTEYLRCYFSGLAMQGLLAGHSANKLSNELLSQKAIDHANELIKQLKLYVVSGETKEAKVENDSFSSLKRFSKSKSIKLIMKK
ncbi:hypothetical protein HZP46_02020 [Elizabethkingia anophelis]|nr:hypothetical protein [Elizabethkingia anophelis]